jgi:hypothetical protein
MNHHASAQLLSSQELTATMNQHRVLFALEKDYQIYDAVHQYTEEERASVWWSKEEYRETKKDAQAIITALEKGRTRIDDCTRGLEQRTRDGSIQKRLATLDSICAVLMEQERQSQQGISNVALIRGAYFTITVKATAEARERGAEDARYDETVDEIEYKNPTIEKTLSVKKKSTRRSFQRFFQVATRRRSGSISSTESQMGRLS